MSDEPQGSGELWSHGSLLLLTLEPYPSALNSTYARWRCLMVGHLGHRASSYPAVGATWIYEWHPRAGLAPVSRT